MTTLAGPLTASSLRTAVPPVPRGRRPRPERLAALQARWRPYRATRTCGADTRPSVGFAAEAVVVGVEVEGVGRADLDWALDVLGAVSGASGAVVVGGGGVEAGAFVGRVTAPRRSRRRGRGLSGRWWGGEGLGDHQGDGGRTGDADTHPAGLGDHGAGGEPGGGAVADPQLEAVAGQALPGTGQLHADQPWHLDLGRGGRGGRGRWWRGGGGGRGGGGDGGGGRRRLGGDAGGVAAAEGGEPEDDQGGWAEMAAAAWWWMAVLGRGRVNRHTAPPCRKRQVFTSGVRGGSFDTGQRWRAWTVPSGLPTKASSAWSVNRPCSTTPRVALRAVARVGRSVAGRVQSRRWWPSSVTNGEPSGVGRRVALGTRSRTRARVVGQANRTTSTGRALVVPRWGMSLGDSATITT